MRKSLSPRRSSLTFEFEHHTMAGGVQRFTSTIGFYDDNQSQPAEAFLNSDKLSTDVDVNARDTAILMSIALQYGAPLKLISEALTRGSRGEPQGVAGSLVDAFVREVRK